MILTRGVTKSSTIDKSPRSWIPLCPFSRTGSPQDESHFTVSLLHTNGDKVQDDVYKQLTLSTLSSQALLEYRMCRLCVCTVYNATHTNGDKVQDDTINKRLILSSQALVDSLRSDSAYVHSALTQGLEASVRLFACQGCDNYWWRKVPARKEVGRLLAVHGGCPWTYDDELMLKVLRCQLTY